GGTDADHLLAGADQLVLVVDSDLLEGRARAVAFRLRAVDVRIVQMALQPASRRFLQPGLLLHPRRQRPRAAAAPARTLARLLHRGGTSPLPSRRLRRQTPSSAISSDSMPSRRPR